MAQVPGMAVEVFLGNAAPNLSATIPSDYSATATFPIVNTPPPTGNIVVAQAPSGSVTNQSATWNFANSETSTQNKVAAIIAASDHGVSFNFNEGTPPAPPGFNVAQTIPSGPGGSTQQGTPAISNLALITASFGGVPASEIAVFKFQ